ncbi:HAD family hydrolase [Altererythrobacter sp. MTPC7]|uniref:HAD family hydrolase n=1 Tax=Altererythrobacter sp. MTPC7 TaxID=3056567 RepID=UPI0036F3DE3A|nr:HAD family hydrolase [Erythrobacteraceae bacterium WH01K]
MTYNPDGRPLVISDCDEVLLYMVSHFRDWLDETQGIAFDMEGNDFANALKRKDSGEPVEQKEIWRLLNAFFDTEMARQDPIPGAVEAIAALKEHADVVILTNLLDERREMRAAQLQAVGIDAKVYTNQGPKGPAIAAILDEYQPSHAIFIDDLAQHHGSAKETVPHVTRLHLCGEPGLAPHITCGEKAGHAHARIDSWDEALPWIMNKLKEPA